MVLIQLLLPIPGTPTQDPSPLAQTRQELSDRFTGVTAYVRSPAKGLWTNADGRTEADDVVMVEVVSATFDRAWWRTYASILERRFHQESIHIRAIQLEMLGDDSH